jgi:hypothetical protein
MFSENFWPFVVYSDPKLDFRRLDLLQAVADARGRTGALLNSVDPDLRAVRAAGKKIIQYHGWADAVIPAQYSIGYYEAAEKCLGTDDRDFYRLFMAPGVEHCGGGPDYEVPGRRCRERCRSYATLMCLAQSRPVDRKGQHRRGKEFLLLNCERAEPMTGPIGGRSKLVYGIHRDQSSPGTGRLLRRDV